MALINCPKCERTISEYATVCPHCGKGIIPLNKDYEYALNEAKKEYELLHQVLYTLDSKLNWDSEISITLHEAYDLGLQSFLLSVAAEEGNFSFISKEFISSICTYADLFSFVHLGLPNSTMLSWNNITRLEQSGLNITLETTKNIADIISNNIMPFLDTAIRTYSKVDNTMNECSYLLKVKNHISMIGQLLASLLFSEYDCYNKANPIIRQKVNDLFEKSV